MIATHNTKDFAGAERVRRSSEDASRIPEDIERKPMSISVSVPEELYRKAVEIAEAQRFSADEVFASAFVEHLAAWERLQQRAARGSRERPLAVLDRVPDTEPEGEDRL
jgi:hypothetical protein